MTRRAQLRFVVDDLDQDGAGVAMATDDGAEGLGGAGPLEVHVPGALPGEEISAQIDDVSNHRPVAWAILRAIHQASADRVSPTCAAHGRCGGCVLQHYDVAAQVRWKETRLRHLLAAAPALALAHVAVRPMVTSPRATGYRNNAKLIPAYDNSGVRAAAPAGRRLVLGAYARRTHDVVDLAGCTITEPALELVATALRDILQAECVEPYDEVRLTGLLRYVVLRANAAADVLVTLVTSADAFPAGVTVAKILRAQLPNVRGVVQNVNPSRGNAIYGESQRILGGASDIEDRIGDVRLRISSRAFFQANRDVARAAYDAIARAVALTPTDHVIDAYAGVGGIALTLAPYARAVIGIEEHASAARDATANATLNGIANARFVAGDVGKCLGDVAAADVVVLNPPRKGCTREVLQQVVALRPRTVAYLSCAPETLLRDLAILAALDYRTVELTPFDMLPHTTHIETLAILSVVSG